MNYKLFDYYIFIDVIYIWQKTGRQNWTMSTLTSDIDMLDNLITITDH